MDVSELLMLCAFGRSARVSGVLSGNCRCDWSSLTSSYKRELRALRPSSFLLLMLVCYMPLAQIFGQLAVVDVFAGFGPLQPFKIL